MFSFWCTMYRRVIESFGLFVRSLGLPACSAALLTLHPAALLRQHSARRRRVPARQLSRPRLQNAHLRADMTEPSGSSRFMSVQNERSGESLTRRIATDPRRRPTMGILPSVRASTRGIVAITLLAAAIFCVGSVQAVEKAAVGTDLAADASWTTGAAPTSSDTATWITGSLGPSLTLGAGQSWGGISILDATDDIDITGAGTLTLGAGGMDLSASAVNLTIGNPIALGASQQWIVNDSKTLTASGIISGTGFSLTKAGAGTLTLDGINTFSTGTIFLNGGTVRVGAEAGLGADGNAVTFGGGTLQVTSGFDVSGIGGARKVFGVGGSTGTLAIDTDQTLTLSAGLNLTGSTAGTLIKNGSGTLAINNANNDFNSSTLRLDAGILSLSHSNALGNNINRSTLMSNGGNVVVNSSANLALNALLNVAADAIVTSSGGVASSTSFIHSFFSTTLGGYTLTATTDGLLSSPGIATLDLNAVTLVGNATLNVVKNPASATNRVLVNTITDGGYRLTLKGDGDFAQDGVWGVGGGGGLTLDTSYTGTATLSQSNAFTGGVTINGGALVIARNNPDAFGSGAVTMNGGALAFQIAGANVGDTLNFDRDTTVGGDATIISDRITVIGGRNYQLGILTIGSHTLSIEGGMTASGTAGIIFDSTTLTGSPTFNIVNPVAGGITAFTPNLIGDGGSGHGITKTGNGRLILDKVNTYTGPTTVNAGTLALTGVGSFAASSSIIVGGVGPSGAILDLTAKTGAFSIGAAQLLGGGGTVRLASSGTLNVQGTLSPGNSPGLFTLDAGTTVLSGTTFMEIFGTNRATSPTHGAGFYDAVNVINNGTLQFGGSLTLEFSSLFDSNTTFDLFTPASGSSLTNNFSGVSVNGGFYTGLNWNLTGSTWTSSPTVGGQALEFSSVTGQLVIVPEPNTIALAGIGIAVAGWLARRRN